MPRFDGTGPCGVGPMTGWGRGYCGAGMGRGLAPGYGQGYGFGPGYGRGFGRGFGRSMGRGFGPGPGFGWYSVGYGPEAAAPGPAEDYRSALEARKAFLNAELARTEALIAASGPEDGAKGPAK